MFREIENDKRPITRIQLSNLDVATVSRLVAGLLRQDVSEVTDLAEIVHQRTGGNAFFVLQFLSMLQERGLLLYNLLKYEWTWDTEQIRSETNISENVVEFVARKIQRLPQRVAAVLKVMACFPSTIVDVAFLESILKGLDMVEFASDR
jgi:predicted ATPase